MVSSEDLVGVELVLELDDNPAAKAYQEALFQQGIRALMFVVDYFEGSMSD